MPGGGSAVPPRPLAARLREYALLMRWDKPIGALLLLWPMLWALWIAAQGWPDPLVLAVFVIGVWIMRSAGCVMNDYADRDFDPHVERTRARPLAARRVKPREALGLFVFLGLVALALVLLMNRLTIAMSVVGIVLAASYPFSKRLHYLPQVHLGLAFGWAVPMAFAAQMGSVPPVGWLVFVAAVVWAVIYDTIYAMVDRDDDLSIGVKSTAILFGELDVAITGGFHLVMLAILVTIGLKADLAVWYYLAVGVAGVLALHQMRLIRDRDRRRCFQAFHNNNWYGAVVFAGVVASYHLPA